MRHLLDANVIIALIKFQPAVLRNIRLHSAGEMAIPSIVLQELYFGAFKGERTSRNLKDLEALKLQILQFDAEDGRRAGELRAHLAKAGQPIGPYDVLIAGQALAKDLTLVTRNTREFQRVEGLRVENWET